MIVYEHNELIDILRYEEELRLMGEIPYDVEGMRKAAIQDDYMAATWRENTESLMQFRSARRYKTVDKDVLISYLKYVEMCPAHYFVQRGVNGNYDSISKSDVLEKLYGNGHAQSFLDVYFNYVMHKARSSKITKMVERNSSIKAISQDGTKLGMLPYSVNKQINMRYNYSKEDLIAIPRAYHEYLYVEDGYLMVWGDFSQSDLRLEVVYFIIETIEDAELFINAKDIYEVIAKMMAKFIGKPFVYEEFLEHREMYKELCLSTFYGTRHHVVKHKDEFVKQLTTFLMTKKKYVEFITRIKDAYEQQKSIAINSFFGSYEIISKENSLTDFLNKCLNTPGQLGTSEIMMLTALKILDTFRDLGYRSDDVRIYLARHDELLFRFSKNCIKDLWRLEDMTTISISGFIPLKIGFKYGYNYKNENEELTEEITALHKLNSKENNSFNYEISDTVTKFYPIKRTLLLQMHAYEIEELDKTIVSIYNPLLDCIFYSAVEGRGEQVLDSFMHTTFENLTSNEDFFNKDYDSIVVTSNFTLGDNMVDFVNDSVFVRYNKISDGSLSLVDVMTKYMTHVYCKSNSVTCSLELPLASYEEIIKRVKKVDFNGLI